MNACPFCSENLPARDGACPVCRHELKREWIETPFPNLSPAARAALIASAAEFIQRWNRNLLSSYQSLARLSSSAMRDDEGDRAEDEADDWARQLRDLREGLSSLEGEADVEKTAFRGLSGKLSGRLKSDLSNARRVATLIEQRAPERDRRKLQIEIVESIPWGAFGSHAERPDGAAVKASVLARLRGEGGGWFARLRSWLRISRTNP